MRYELIRELFNNCSGMSVPIVEEIEADDLDDYMRARQFIMPGFEWSREDAEGGAVYRVSVRGTRSRYTFTEL